MAQKQVNRKKAEGKEEKTSEELPAQKVKGHDGSQEQTEKKDVEEQTQEATEKDIGDLVDQIDEVLEENAEEFVRNYVQKGGE